MKGVGYYDERAYYPSSSNLSAFAPPFSVNRSTSKDVSAPYVDLAESTDAIPSNHFPVRSRSYGYDFFSNPVRELDSTPSSKAFGYSGLQVLDPPTCQLPHFNTLGLASKDTLAYDQCSNGKKSSLVEAQPYYASYISPSIDDGNPSAAPNNWSPSAGFANLNESKKSSETGNSGQRAGLWNQFAEFNQGTCKQAEVGGSFCSKETNLTGSVVEENLMNQGCQDIKGSGNGEVLHSTTMMSWEKHGAPISADQLDDKSCWWQTANSMPIDFSCSSIQGSPSVSREIHYEAPLKLVSDSRNHHLSYAASNDKYLKQQAKPSLVDTGSSAPITGLVKDFNVVKITACGDLGGNNITNMKEAYPLPSSGKTGCFDLGQLRKHLERNEPTSSNNGMLSDKSVSMDAVDYIFKARNGFQNPHASLDSLSLGFSTNEGGVNSFEKSFDSVDRCNPAVDSPCWKGAPAAHFSAFEGSEALHPEYVSSNEEYFASSFQWPQNFHLDANNNAKMCCGNSQNNQIHNEIDYQEKVLAGSSRNFSVTNFAAEENSLDGAVNTGCFESKPIYDCGLQYLDDISEMRENSVPSNKSTYDSESRSSNTEQQVIEENKCMSQKHHILCGGCADAKNNINEYLECGTCHAVEPSPSSVEDAPTALKKSASKVSTPKINVQMLVDTMHNLSEFLLFHCLNGACELKEREFNALSNVISNLSTCASKNNEQMIPAHESLLTQPDPSKCARESHELQQNARLERTHLTNVDPEGSKVELGNLPVQQVKSDRFVSGKQGKVSDSFFTKDDAEMMKEDNMTKALKMILSENFRDEEGAESQTLLYKNLWLEAEAAICSINYRARYNQMKIEMEKYSYKRRENGLEVEEQSRLEVDPNLSTTQSSATKANSVPNPNCSAENFLSKELSGLKFSPDLNKPSTSTLEDTTTPDCFIQDSAVSGVNKETGDCEASTKAIFRALYSQVEKPCANTANPGELPSSEASHALDTADKLASGQTYIENQVNFAQLSPIPGKNKGDYLESSVMTRFHILKSQVKDSSSMSSEGQLLDGGGFAGNGTGSTIIRNASEANSLKVNINPVMMHLSSYTAVDKSIPKEFHLNLEDDQEIQPRGNYRSGIQLPTYYSDGFSSEWEHVKMEELAGQTFKP